MTPTLQKYSILLLVIFALLAGFVWRMEVEYHGWKGLIWLSYYHYAVPVCVALFLIWSNLNFKLTPKSRIALNLIGLVFAIALLYILEQAFIRSFMSGPSAVLLLMGNDPLGFLIFVPLFVVLLLPLLLSLLVRIFSVKCKPIFIIMATVFMIASVPIGVFLLEFFDDKCYPDEIHTIKSGYLMTLWFFSMGFTFIQATQKEPRNSALKQADLLDERTD